MLFCDSFSILQGAPPNPKAKTLALSLWKVTDTPLRSTLKSLSKEALTNKEELEPSSILALFSLVEEKSEPTDPIDFEFPVETFSSFFTKESFQHPLTLPTVGFCFILEGIKSSPLCRARCISLTQVLASRPLQPGSYLKFDRVFDLFPVAAQFSLRFPISPPPFSQTSFLPSKTALFQVKSTQKSPELKWSKADKQARWRDHLSEIIPGLYIGSEVVAQNGDTYCQCM